MIFFKTKYSHQRVLISLIHQTSSGWALTTERIKQQSYQSRKGELFYWCSLQILNTFRLWKRLEISWSKHKSIKSQRSYQVGLLFGDAYGRETPIFTSENASIKAIQNLPKEVPLQISTTVDSDIPSWAHYYKFYVKESSGRYYNLLNDYMHHRNNNP